MALTTAVTFPTDPSLRSNYIAGGLGNPAKFSSFSRLQMPVVRILKLSETSGISFPAWEPFWDFSRFTVRPKVLNSWHMRGRNCKSSSFELCIINKLSR